MNRSAFYTPKKASLDELLDMLYEPEEAFVVPVYVCGDFLLKSDFDEEFEFSFRRMPRKHGYAGKYGLWWHDPDQGKVLLGVYNPATQMIERESNVEEHHLSWQIWQKWVETEANGMRTSYACAWCGREVVQDNPVVQTHLHPNCQAKAY